MTEIGDGTPAPWGSSNVHSPQSARAAIAARSVTESEPESEPRRFGTDARAFHRSSAWVVDAMVLFPVQLASVWLFGRNPEAVDVFHLLVSTGAGSFGLLLMLPTDLAVTLIVGPLVYRSVLEGTGGTVGKRVMGLTTVGRDGQRLGLMRAAGREVIGKTISTWFLFMGYWGILVDGRALHDKVVDGRVMHRD